MQAVPPGLDIHEDVPGAYFLKLHIELLQCDYMSWATHFIEKLKAGETVQFRPRGNSMRGKIESGQLVTVEPPGDRQWNKGDIVLCKVNGSQYLHLIKAVQGERFQIGNNVGRINGWITLNSIYGICTSINQ
jgi:hypothetical protein